MEKTETLGTRLKQLMKERQLNYEKLGELLDMKPQSLNRYVLGQREPKARVVLEMAERLQVDDRWLQGYDVPRTRTDPLKQEGQVLLPILGVIRAGVPELASQQILGYMAADIKGDIREYFYLKVQGESMKNAGIHSGDFVLIHVQPTAEDGQIVACIVDGEDATLKRYHRQGDWVILQPENAEFSPRLVSIRDFELGTARIVGVAVRMTRNL